jgi:KEOPS complex subunit Cgi121
MESIVRKAREKGSEVLVLDGRMVFGSDHLAAALYHAARAIEEGSNASDSLLMETMLYASGERQLSAATKKMGVTPDCTELVVAKLDDGDFLPDPSWKGLSASRAETDSEALLRFGISDAEISTLAGRSPVELVLEKVAAEDILKR